MSTQSKILKFIADCQRENGKAPTLREVAKQFDLASSTIAGYYKRMERDGIIHRIPRSRRAVKVLTHDDKSLIELRLNVRTLEVENEGLKDEVQRYQEKLKSVHLDMVKQIAAVLKAIPSMSDISWIVQIASRQVVYVDDPLTVAAKKVGLIGVKNERLFLTEFGRLLMDALF